MTSSPRPPFVSRADLHVHSWHSKVNGDLPFFKSRDCYSRPTDVYRTAKARGMDIVTITDHDSIDGCLELFDRFPGASDILMGEEVSCTFPDGDIDVHLAVYGMTEALHRDVQPLRRNVFEVIALSAGGRRVLRAEPSAALLPRPGSAGVVSAAAFAGPWRRGAQRDDDGAAQSAHRAPARAIPGPCRRRRQRRAHVAADRPHVDRGAGQHGHGVPGQPARRPRPSGRTPRRRRRRRRRCLRGGRTLLRKRPRLGTP